MQKLKIKCSYSAVCLEYGIDAPSSKPLTLLHPLMLAPLPQLESLLAASSEQSHTACHLLFCAFLARCPQVRYHAPLLALPHAFYQVHLPRLATQAARLARITFDWPGLAISKDEQGEAPIINWLNCLEAIESPHILHRPDKHLDDEYGIQQIIQYIWATPQIKAKQAWVENKLKKALFPETVASVCRVVASPSRYPSQTLSANKSLLLEYAHITSEHDGNMLTAIITSLDKHLLKNLTRNAAIEYVTKETDQLVAELEKTTHWKNQELVVAAKEAIAQGGQQLVTAENMQALASAPQPRPENYSNPIRYKIALASWKAAGGKVEQPL